jgi:hypothetical protein
MGHKFIDSPAFVAVVPGNQAEPFGKAGDQSGLALVALVRGGAGRLVFAGQFDKELSFQSRPWGGMWNLSDFARGLVYVIQMVGPDPAIDGGFDNFLALLSSGYDDLSRRSRQMDGQV